MRTLYSNCTWTTTQHHYHQPLLCWRTCYSTRCEAGDDCVRTDCHWGDSAQGSFCLHPSLDLRTLSSITVCIILYIEPKYIKLTIFWKKKYSWGKAALLIGKNCMGKEDLPTTSSFLWGGKRKINKKLESLHTNVLFS